MFTPKAGTMLLLAFKPPALRQFGTIHMDARVYMFVFGISLLTGLLFGFQPAWSACRGDVADGFW